MVMQLQMAGPEFKYGLALTLKDILGFSIMMLG